MTDRILYCLNLNLSLHLRFGSKSPVTFKMKLYVAWVNNSFQLLPFLSQRAVMGHIWPDLLSTTFLKDLGAPHPIDNCKYFEALCNNGQQQLPVIIYFLSPRAPCYRSHRAWFEYFNIIHKIYWRHQSLLIISMIFIFLFCCETAHDRK